MITRKIWKELRSKRDKTHIFCERLHLCWFVIFWNDILKQYCYAVKRNLKVINETDHFWTAFRPESREEKDSEGGPFPAYPSGKTWDEPSGKTGSGKKFFHNIIDARQVDQERSQDERHEKPRVLSGWNMLINEKPVYLRLDTHKLHQMTI